MGRPAVVSGLAGRRGDQTVTLQRRERLLIASQFIGVNFLRWYVSITGPTNRPLFSERNRINCRVLPLEWGWRVVIRRRWGYRGVQ